MQKSYIPLFFLLITLAACGPGKKPSQIKDQDTLEKLTPNIAYLVSTYENAWETTLKVIQYDFLLPIEVKDQEKGFFSTALIKEYDETPNKRFRITGDLSSDNQETMIKIYKSEEIKNDDGDWQTNLSDFSLESEIVRKIKNMISKK